MSGRGRPSLYTPELAEGICRRLASGESLRAICRDDGMPDERAVRLWACDPEHPFSPQYAKAREIGYLSMFDEMLEIADTPVEGKTVTTKLSKDGDLYDETRRADMIEHRRLQVDTRKWALAKMLPKVFGDRIESLARHQLVDENAKPVPLEMARRIAFALAQATADTGAAAPTPTQH